MVTRENLVPGASSAVPGMKHLRFLPTNTPQ